MKYHPPGLADGFNKTCAGPPIAPRLRVEINVAGTMDRPIQWGHTMKKLSILFAGLYLAAMLGGISTARAHSAAQCKKQLQNYAKMCKFSPSMWILGFCKNKKAQAWCSDKKMHAEKFHK